ncbi:MAG TPA: 50S ribosomal protein L23 [Candidatus Omnitrophota bacterium]|nr:50S ribosomal protein L23 [Candidatus Omnitrophota bacterium]
MEPAQIILEPMITEKAISAKAEGRYVFKVHPASTKIDVRRAVEKLFKVKVADVNTVSNHGKARMMGWKSGRTPSFKKAYVTLKTGQKIEELEV